jgi:hypothetical protein
MDREEVRQRLDDLVSRYRETVGRTASQPGLQERVRALASFQSRRLAATYAELRATGRYRDAVDFFLADLYGPHDLSDRDEQVIRALDKLKRFLPAAALDALVRAFELHVLTIELDAATAAQLTEERQPDAISYAVAYRAAGHVEDRDRQIALVDDIGRLLDSLAQRPEVGIAIRIARGPAHAAGYGQLQDFLERGYAAFKRMGGATEFLAVIERRERELMQRLLSGGH